MKLSIIRQKSFIALSIALLASGFAQGAEKIYPQIPKTSSTPISTSYPDQSDNKAMHARYAEIRAGYIDEMLPLILGAIPDKVTCAANAQNFSTTPQKVNLASFTATYSQPSFNRLKRILSAYKFLDSAYTALHLYEIMEDYRPHIQSFWVASSIAAAGCHFIPLLSYVTKKGFALASIPLLISLIGDRVGTTTKAYFPNHTSSFFQRAGQATGEYYLNKEERTITYTSHKPMPCRIVNTPDTGRWAKWWPWKSAEIIG